MVLNKIYENISSKITKNKTQTNKQKKVGKTIECCRLYVGVTIKKDKPRIDLHG